MSLASDLGLVDAPASQPVSCLPPSFALIELWRSKMHRSNRALRVFVLLSALILLSSVGSGSMPTSAAAQTASDQSVIYLNKAWSQDDREWYYHFSQGSAVLSYDIVLNLEVANSQELFRSDANSIRYG